MKIVIDIPADIYECVKKTIISDEIFDEIVEVISGYRGVNQYNIKALSHFLRQRLLGLYRITPVGWPLSSSISTPWKFSFSQMAFQRVSISTSKSTG